MNGSGDAHGRWAWWLAVLSWASLIFVLSSIPEASLPDAGPPDSLLDTLVTNGAHLGLYGVLGALLRRAFGEGSRAGWYAWAVALMYGISDEWHQSFVPGREWSLFDLALDGVGAGLGLLAVAWATAVRHGHRQRQREAHER